MNECNFHLYPFTDFHELRDIHIYMLKENGVYEKLFILHCVNTSTHDVIIYRLLC